jgi:copper(I)-binding protein
VKGKRMIRFKIFMVVPLAFVLVVGLSACDSNEDVMVSDVWARPGLAEGNSAVFFVLNNNSELDDRLLNAYSDVAKAVELHKSSMVDGKMKMEMQKDIPVLAGETLVFKPGDFHVMLIGLENDLAVGDQFEVRLEFEKAGELNLEVVVTEP